MSAPFISARKKRPPASIRRVTVLGREYRDVAYTPKFALGIVCADEGDQQRLYGRLRRIIPGKDIKVLVI